MNTTMPPERSLGNERRHGRLYDGYGAGNSPYGHARQRYVSLDAVGGWRRRDGDDRQLSIWLDVLRPRHSEELRMGSRIDPMGVHALRAVRDLAGAGRRLVRR